MKRLAGVLNHPTSLPGPFGIGDLGSSAYRFVDFLHKAKVGLWQVLPLGPTSYGDSPYQSFSTFAGNPLLISPELLVREGYLEEADIANPPDFPADKVDYGNVIPYKQGLYEKAFQAFQEKGTKAQKTAYAKYCRENKLWLEDYTLFVAIKQHYIEKRRNTVGSPEYMAYTEENKDALTESQINDYYYGAVWNSWPAPLAAHDQIALREWAKAHEQALSFQMFLQYEFQRQWKLLKAYANEKGIQIIGDIPIFVAMDSSDVWANPSLFELNTKGKPTEVAGVPPDYFSELGQLWGNPLYRWEVHKQTDYAWWTRRIEAALAMVDLLRIDHFRGFESYWAVPYGEKTAINGHWCKGPGKALFASVLRALGALPIVAEDLGLITDKVIKLRDGLSLPGMKVLQFAFDDDSTQVYLPHNVQSAHCVMYTGTHDNDTSVGWYASAPEKARDYFRRYASVSGDDPAWDMIRLAYASAAAYAIVPVQDIMRLGSDARMNMPGTPSNCWQFRYREGDLNDGYAEGLLYLAQLFNRCGEEAR